MIILDKDDTGHTPSPQEAQLDPRDPSTEAKSQSYDDRNDTWPAEKMAKSDRSQSFEENLQNRHIEKARPGQ